MAAAKRGATSGFRGKLQEKRHFCEDGGEAVPTTTVKIIDWAREEPKTDCKNANCLSGLRT